MKTLNVLLVDDDPLQVRMLKSVLYNYDLRFFEANTIDEAFFMFIKESIDFLIADIVLEDFMDGIDLAKEFNIPTILVSGHYDKYIEKSMSVEDMYFATKPYDIRQFDLYLKKVFEQFKDKSYEEVILSDDYIYNIKTKTIFYQNSRVKLTSNETVLLFLLVTHRNGILTSETIAKVIFKKKVETSAQRTLLYRLRGKLKDLSIDTVKPLGIRLNSKS
jgi:two-component system alkaline phosphatase synthesis response regulator PhoP/two-component system response regulator RegX3